MTCSRVEWGMMSCRVDKSVAISTRAVEASKSIGASLTADSKLLTLIHILAGAPILGKAEPWFAEAAGPAWRV